jgi:hypothetical protein
MLMVILGIIQYHPMIEPNQLRSQIFNNSKLENWSVLFSLVLQLLQGLENKPVDFGGTYFLTKPNQMVAFQSPSSRPALGRKLLAVRSNSWGITE